MVNSKDRADFAMLLTLAGKPENSRSRVAKGSQYKITASPSAPCRNEVEIPSSGALKPSGFCNVGVYLRKRALEHCKLRNIVIWGRAKVTCCIIEFSTPIIGVFGPYFALFSPIIIVIGNLSFTKLI